MTLGKANRKKLVHKIAGLTGEKTRTRGYPQSQNRIGGGKQERRRKKKRNGPEREARTGGPCIQGTKRQGKNREERRDRKKKIRKSKSNPGKPRVVK